MFKTKKALAALFMLQLFFVQFALGEQSGPEYAQKLIERSEAHTRGNSLQADVQMTVHDGDQKRELSLKTWTQGRDKAVIKILKPAKDKGTGNLRLQLNVWQFLPNIDRIVKLPPSMMLQSWMGSDFTNDDLVKSSSLSRDYTHLIEKKDKLGEISTFKIICTPKPDAPVTWGKVIVWLRDPDSVPLKQEYYSENGDLLKIMEGADVKTFGQHIIPTELTMTNLKKKNAKTILKYQKLIFDEKIDETIFSQEFIRKPVKE